MWKADEIELEFWPSFSTKIIAFNLDKIPKVFHSQTMQNFNIKCKILLFKGGVQVLIRLFMNVVILPIKCIYGANKHNIVIGSWQKWKWQWASEKMLLAEQRSDWAEHKSLGSVLCFPSVVKLRYHQGGKGVLLALSAQVHPQHKHTPTSIWASLDIIPTQNIMCCVA